jgi:hypothetical protein
MICSQQADIQRTFQNLICPSPCAGINTGELLAEPFRQLRFSAICQFDSGTNNALDTSFIDAHADC